MYRCNFCGSHFEEPDIKRCKPYTVRQGGFILDRCDTKEVCPDCEDDDIEEYEEVEDDDSI
jgi:rubrerythrin